MSSSTKASYGDRIKRSAKKNNSKIILALDMSVDQPHNPELITKIIDQLASYFCAVKINFHLLLSYSPQEIRCFNELVHSYDLQSIADIKLNDIPNTNSVAVNHLQSIGFDCLIVNPIMGKNSLTSLVDFAHALNLGVLSVVYMSSPYARQTYGLKVILSNSNAEAKVNSLYEIFLKYSLDSNVDGIIVGANRIPIIKSISGRSFLPIYSPGVGVQGGVIEKAMENGSKYVFIGRSVLNSSNPRAFLQILKEASNKYSA
jgi:orotidine-5'-phosphate decarboxylase